LYEAENHNQDVRSHRAARYDLDLFNRLAGAACALLSFIFTAGGDVAATPLLLRIRR
jgi:hypothetical protein